MGGWPDRLYIIDRTGRVAYQGGPGPAGFKPDLMEQQLKKVLDNDGIMPGLLPAGVTYGTFMSKTMDKRFGYSIYLPDGYAAGAERYPVIYWLHGINGNEITGTHVSTNLAAPSGPEGL